MTARITRPHFSANAFLTVANVVYLLLAMSILTLIGCLPLILAFVFAPGLGFYPLYLIAAALSAPGIAASFAMFRDHPVFLTSARRDALTALAESHAASSTTTHVVSTTAAHDASATAAHAVSTTTTSTAAVHDASTAAASTTEAHDASATAAYLTASPSGSGLSSTATAAAPSDSGISSTDPTASPSDSGLFSTNSAVSLSGSGLSSTDPAAAPSDSGLSSTGSAAFPSGSASLPGSGFVPNDACPWLPDWIAAPYVPSDVSVAVFRPYFVAYRRVALRALAVGFTFSLIEFLALYDAQLLIQVTWGQFLVPAMFVLAVISVEAELVALNLVVEFPKAKWRSLLRNGYLCGVRRFVMLIVNIACLGVYVWGLTRSPILVGVLATGVLAFVLWAGVRWQSRPLALAMARESDDRHLISLYD